MISNNVKPFETLNVGPGLNQGFTTLGSNGFNSGMEARDMWLDKTVDQLRVDTNPKLEYSLENLEGPSHSRVQNIGIIGRVEKHTPDTFFINSEDRWFTTNSSEKQTTYRDTEQPLGNVKRTDFDINYTGIAGLNERGASYAPTNFQDSRRIELEMTEAGGPSNATSRGPITDGENNINSYNNYSNNRSTTRQPETMRNSFNAVIGAVVAPLLDVLRPSRKQDTLYSSVAPAANKSGVRIYDSVYLQTSNGLKTTTIENRPNHGGTQIFNQQMNVSLSKQDSDRNNNRLFTPHSVVSLPPGKEMVGNISAGNQYTYKDYDKTGIDRINPDLLNAFRANPYTHPLTTSV